MNLQRLFNRLNQKYWNGRLPLYKVIISDKYGSHGLCQRKTRTIWIQDGLKRSLPKFLLHEMCHIRHLDHGKLWQMEMLRIAKLGAPTKGEALIYRSANKTFSKDFIIAEAEDHGFELPTMPWKEYRQQIGYKYGQIDKSGKAESKGARDLLRKVRQAFLKGQRQKEQIKAARLAQSLKSKAEH
jgi:hypothetical protein